MVLWTIDIVYVCFDVLNNIYIYIYYICMYDTRRYIYVYDIIEHMLCVYSTRYQSKLSMIEPIIMDILTYNPV